MPGPVAVVQRHLFVDGFAGLDRLVDRDPDNIATALCLVGGCGPSALKLLG